MNASEQIADWLVSAGIEQVFMVTGGGAMFLNHALGSHPHLRCTFMHHEQACAMAAEAYARISGKPAVVCVTTGPGGINALNGIFGAWTDSVPMLILAGQVKRETCLDFVDLPGLRQLGDQEGPVVHMAKHTCKFVGIAREIDDIGTLLPSALDAAVSDRPGPAWIDVPLDVQSSRSTIVFSKTPASGPATPSATEIESVIDALRQTHRPLVVAGSGVRTNNAGTLLLSFIERTGIPLATAWTHDLIESNHPLFAGRPGTIGTRAGNFCLQAADCILVIGSRLNIRQISYNWKSFAEGAHVIQVDVDPAELKKPFVRPRHAIRADAAVFLDRLAAACTDDLPDYSAWAKWCHSLRTRFTETYDRQSDSEVINPYIVTRRIFSQLRRDDIIVCGNASACIIPFQVANLQADQRMFSNSGAASMGYDLPAAIGAAIAAPERRVICFAGDGSLQMNIQELQTLKTLSCNIIVIVLANNGYLSIRQTHENFFGTVIGATPDSGVDFPDFSAIAKAYGLNALRVSDHAQCAELDLAIQSDGPFLIQIDVDPAQGFEPRIKSRMLPDGSFSTPALDDMFPFLPEEQVEMIRREACTISSRPQRERHP